jgi:hypothetical protein
VVVDDEEEVVILIAYGKLELQGRDIIDVGLDEHVVACG